MRARSGFILLYCVLMTLALALLTTGLLAVATRETTIAVTHLGILQARAAAEGAARVAAGAWSTRDHIALLPGEAATVEGAAPGTRLTITRLDSTLFLITAEAGSRDAPTARDGTVRPIARAMLMLRTLDSRLLPLMFPAAATAGRMDLRAGTISGADVCPRLGPSRPGVLAETVHITDAMLSGVPAVRIDAPPAPPTHDPLATLVIAAIANAVVTGTGSPGPVAHGPVCVPGAWNWGALSPAHPCHDRVPVIHATGPLTVRGGSGRGILVAENDLVLEQGFEFEGLILGRGNVAIRGGATVRGAIRAAGLELDGGSVLADHCAVDAAVGASAFDRPLRPARRWWLPAF